jgi:hypothetical protein
MADSLPVLFISSLIQIDNQFGYNDTSIRILFLFFNVQLDYLKQYLLSIKILSFDISRKVECYQENSDY